jgi:SAM-dependent methyltransferase
MTTSAILTHAEVPAPAPTYPADLSGDAPLSAAERRAYIRYHEQRNNDNALASRHIDTLPARPGDAPAPAGATPSRVDMLCFIQLAGGIAADRFGDRPITIIDIGCGTGRQLDAFARAGLTGRYIGLDIERHRDWRDGARDGFTRELIVADIHTIDLRSLPTPDLVVSATALEHIRDDRAVVHALRDHTAPGGMHAHFVPAEASLRLYGPHGWRQYSPACLRAMFPDGSIYRYGGCCSNMLHESWITRRLSAGDAPVSTEHPRLYAAARSAARTLDRALGNHPAAMYGVIELFDA